MNLYASFAPSWSAAVHWPVGGENRYGSASSPGMARWPSLNQVMLFAMGFYFFVIMHSYSPAILILVDDPPNAKAIGN